jgi:hypothetical protein
METSSVENGYIPTRPTSMEPLTTIFLRELENGPSRMEMNFKENIHKQSKLLRKKMMDLKDPLN